MNPNDKTTFNIQNPGAVTQIGSEIFELQNRFDSIERLAG